MGKNIGHRLGGRTRQTENTVSAVYSTLNLAKNKNFRYWETDIRESKDGILYCYHDDTLGDKEIDELNWEEIRLDAKNLGVEIPLFTEIIKLLEPRNEKFMIEIKFIHSDEARRYLLDIVSSNQKWSLMSTPSRFIISFPRNTLGIWAKNFQFKSEKIVRVGRHSVDLFKVYNNLIYWHYAKIPWFFGF